jgi:hypothetical protein
MGKKPERMKMQTLQRITRHENDSNVTRAHDPIKFEVS